MEDVILRDYILSAASVINATGGSNGDNPTQISIVDCSRVAATLDSNNAMKFVSGEEGTLRFGSGPIRSCYFMLSNTAIQPDLDSLVGQGFFSSWNYAQGNTNALPTEFGSILNFRILTSSEASYVPTSSMNSHNVYYNTCLGKQGVTHIDQDGYSMKLIYRDPYYSGPLAQNATLAVKFAQAQALTQDTAIRQLATTVGYN